MEIGKKIISMLGLHVLNGVVPLITLPYIIRTLGLEEFGKVSVALAVNQHLLLLSEYGFTLGASREVARNSENDRHVNEIFWNVQFAKLCLMVLSLLILLVVVAVVPPFSVVQKLLYIGFFMVVGYFLTPTWLFLGKAKMDRLMLFTILPRMLAIPFIFGFVRSEADGVAAMLSQVVPIMATGVASALYSYNAGWWGRCPARLGLARQQLKDGFPLFVSSVSSSIYTASPPMFLGVLVSSSAAGAFSAAHKLIVAAQSLIVPISQVIYPRLNALIVEKPCAALRLMRYVLLGQGGVNLCIALTLFTLSPHIARIAYSSSAPGTDVLIKLLSPLVFFIGLSSVLGTHILLTLGYVKWFGRGIVLGAVCAGVLLPLLSIWWHAEGAAIALCMAEGVILTSHIYALARVSAGEICPGASNSVFRMMLTGGRQAD